MPSARCGKPFSPFSCWLEKSRHHPSPNYRLLLFPLIVSENLNTRLYFWRRYAWTFICYVISRQMKDEMVVNIQVDFITITFRDMSVFYYNSQSILAVQMNQVVIFPYMHLECFSICSLVFYPLPDCFHILRILTPVSNSPSNSPSSTFRSSIWTAMKEILWC